MFKKEYTGLLIADKPHHSSIVIKRDFFNVLRKYNFKLNYQNGVDKYQ